MRRLPLLLTLILLAAAARPAPAPPVPADEAAIRAALDAQAAAWNRADIPAFMKTYEDSP